MHETTQQTFGNTEITKSHKSGICSECPNSSFLIIKSKFERRHYCKMCARRSWINEVEEMEE